jgi:hypothetical protein
VEVNYRDIKCTERRRGKKERSVAKKIKKKRGLYANIHAKRKRIKAGSGERMRKRGAKGAPTNAQFKRAAKTAKKRRRKKKA